MARVKIIRRTIFALFLALDLLLSALTFGAPLETISARLAKARQHGNRAAAVAAGWVDWVALKVFAEPNHCESSYAAYLAREMASRPWSWWH